MRADGRGTGSGAVVTGIGIVAPAGVGIDSFREGALGGVPPLSDSPASLPGAPVPARAITLEGCGFEAAEHIDPRAIRRLSRLSVISCIAARSALESAGVAAGADGGEASLDDVAVVLGTAFGSSAYHFEYYEALFERGIREASPLLFSESVLNAASGHITQQLGLRGPGLTLVGGEDAGLQALLTALDLVRRGDVPAVLAGGAEEYCAILHAALGQAGVVGDRPGQPYTPGGAPSPLGEGAAILVVEDGGAAARRGAPILARVAGAGTGRSAPGEDVSRAVAFAVAGALGDAGLDAGDIDAIVGGGSGGAVDGAEVRGLLEIFPASRKLSFAAPKESCGEAFAFTSAAQAVIAVLALGGDPLPAPGGEPALLPASWRGSPGPPGRVLAVSPTRAGGATAVILDGASPLS